MAFSCNKSILTLLVSFLILFHVFPSTRADLIDDACVDAGNVDFCKTALRSDARATGADLKTLAQIGIDLTESNVKSTVSLVKSLLAGVSITADPSMKAFYQTCLELYNDAFYGLRKCPGFLKNQDYDSLNIYASGVETDVDDCGYDFTGEPDELKHAGQKVQSVASVVAYASHVLGGH